MTNVGRKYRSMTYHPLAGTHAFTHTHTHALASHFGLQVCCPCNRILLEISCMRLPPTSKGALKFQSILRSEVEGGREGARNLRKKLRLTCFPLQNPHCGAYLTRRINIFIVLRSRKEKENVKIDKLLRSGQLLKAFNRRHISHGHN